MKVYINADIYKNDSTAFIVEDGIFEKLGSNEEILEAAAEDAEIVDLKGSFVVPGFIDSHMHLLEYGYYLNHLQLDRCRSLQQLLDEVRQWAETHEDAWIIGRGFNEELFEQAEYPVKAQLDAISKDRPIVLTRVCGHKMVCNSKALELCCMDESAYIAGGTIDFEAGALAENALNVVHQTWPKETEKQLQEDIMKGAEAVNQYGITSVGSDDFISIVNDWKLVADSFMQLSYQGKMSVRVNEQCEFMTPEDFAEFLDEGYTTDVGDEYFKIGPLKLMNDGSLGARTAALMKPYSDDRENSGYTIYTKAELKILMEAAADYNMGTIVHCIGDKAVDQTLKVMEKIVLPGNPLHHGIVHCQIMNKEQTQKVCDMKLNAYFQSLFIDSDAKILEERVGQKRAETSYPYKQLYEGTCASNGSDAPVEVPDVLKGIQLAVTRTALDGSASMNPQECLSIEQAIDSYTIKGAEAFFEDDIKGKIEENYLADFVVLDHNLLKMDPHQISHVKVLMTVTGGRTVYER